MLIETIILSCSAAGAVLGGCNDSCETIIGASEVVICEDRGGSNSESKQSETNNPGLPWTPPPPWIMCQQYVSGGVEIPTFGKIWVKVREGSRPCLDQKPYVPIPDPPSSTSKTVEVVNIESVQEIFRTSPSSPMAYVEPAERYYDEQFSFRVESTSQLKSGELFGEPVSVRFIPRSATWSFGKSGFNVSHIFGEKGDFSAKASVSFQVDYKPLGESWVVDAGSISVSSNSLLITALPLPRETRLVG